MKIIAVIPARAGSKGIPNKNIRIIQGRPMIYYAIHNALEAQMVTDVVVSTDSSEVAIIAKQMGAKVKWREARLCTDEVTLDAVVYDAVKDEECDYVVTMQPTSPTLHSDTIDDAIRYMLEKNLDTVISAINAPHLSWGEKDGVKVPNYVKRLNRQYLPPCYMETGAFMISRAAIVSETTRIGKRVDVYEITEEEAIDIDNFNDLKSAISVMEQKSVAIYVNGNNKRGLGHIYRALELADEFYVKPDIYYDINQTDRSVFGKTTHNLIPVDGIVELYEICKKKQYNIFVNDILSTTLDYMIGLRRVLPSAKIVNFEDEGEGALKSDLVINALYKKSNDVHVYGGEKYYIAGKMFLLYEPIEIKKNVKKVFICFGGADPSNYSDRLLKIIAQKEYSAYQFVVVLGKTKMNADQLLEYNKFDHINVYHNVNNIAELMHQCDVAITSRGRTGFELAMLGIPTISMAQNAMEEAHDFMCNENGFAYIGLNPPDEIIESTLKMYISSSAETRKHFQEVLISHDLRNGRKRVMGLINSL